MCNAAQQAYGGAHDGTRSCRGLPLDIAFGCSLSKKTASVHVAHIKDKLGVGSRVEIATEGIRLGLVKPLSAGQRCAADLLVGAGVYPRIAQELLRHASSGTTMEIYSQARRSISAQTSTSPASRELSVARLPLSARLGCNHDLEAGVFECHRSLSVACPSVR